MSALADIANLLERMHKHSAVIAQAYHQGMVSRMDENAASIEALRSLRLLTPHFDDTYVLRSSVRRFLDVALNTERLFQSGSNYGALLESLMATIQVYLSLSTASEDERDRYESEIREYIVEIADSIEDDLLTLETLAATRFGVVRTIAEKIAQNAFYQTRARRLVEFLEGLSFAELSEQLEPHRDLHRMFQHILMARLPVFLNNLSSILQRLERHLFEYRTIEQRASRIRMLGSHYRRHPDWEPRDWADVVDPPGWLQLSAPMTIIGSPAVRLTQPDTALVDIASSIRDGVNESVRRLKPEGNLLPPTAIAPIMLANSPMRLALHAYQRESVRHPEGVWARGWASREGSPAHPFRPDVWLLSVIHEFSKREYRKRLFVETRSATLPECRGNEVVFDVRVTRRGLVPDAR